MSQLNSDFLERFAADAVRQGLVDVLYTRVRTPIGKLLLGVTDKGLCRVAFEEEREEETLAELAAKLGPRVVLSNEETAEFRETVAAYLEGESTDLSLPFDLSLVPSQFRRDVLETLYGVPRGEVVTYGELARRVAHPRAARAAGSACARNPVPLVVPCHRVVPGSGGVGNYGGGAHRKRWLLELEGVTR